MTATALLVAVWFRVVLDFTGKPLCHKPIMVACQVWLQEEDGEKRLPNVRGESVASMPMLVPLMGGSTNTYLEDHKRPFAEQVRREHEDTLRRIKAAR